MKISMFDQYTLRWIFRNGHEWTQTWASAQDRADWIARVVLLTDPNIVQITEIDPEGERDLKRVG